jgi:hypothetical protein
MSQDPNADNRPASEQPYDTPPPDPVSEPAPDSYGLPDPYGVPLSSHPYSSPDFYETPPAPPDGQPDQYSSAPPPPDPYGVPSIAGYEARQEHSYEIPSTPLPLGEAIRQLPGQYRRILTRPSAQTFVMEMGKAAWNITWVQLIAYAVIAALLSWLAILISPASRDMGAAGASPLSPAILQAITLASSIGLVVLVPLSFFIHQGITYLIARAFNGNGTFLRQAYTALLFQVPLGIASSLLGLVPIVGLLVGIAALIYEIVLAVFSIMAVHRLSGGKATAVVILPVLILGIVFCAVAVTLGVIIGLTMSSRYR